MNAKERLQKRTELYDLQRDAARWRAWSAAMVACVKIQNLEGNPFLNSMETSMTNVQPEHFTIEKLNAAVDKAMKEAKQ